MSSPLSEAPVDIDASAAETEQSPFLAKESALESAVEDVTGSEVTNDKNEEKKLTAFYQESADKSEEPSDRMAEEAAGTSRFESTVKSSATAADERERDQRDRLPHSNRRENDDASCYADTGELAPFDPTSKLAEYEELFKNRYTDDDPEYAKSAVLETIEPVMIAPWPPSGGGGNRYGGGSRGGQQLRGGRYQHWQNSNHNYRHNQQPYGNQWSNGNGYSGQRQGRYSGYGGGGYNNGTGGGGGGGYGSHYGHGNTYSGGG